VPDRVVVTTDHE